MDNIMYNNNNTPATISIAIDIHTNKHKYSSEKGKGRATSKTKANKKCTVNSWQIQAQYEDCISRKQIKNLYNRYDKEKYADGCSK